MSTICMVCLDKEAEYTHEQYVTRRGEEDSADAMAYVFVWREPLCAECMEKRFASAIKNGHMEWTYDG